MTECGWGQFEVKIEIHFHSMPIKASMSPYRDILPSKRQRLSNHNNKPIYHNYNDM